MFGGPNGSGKSTLVKDLVSDKSLDIYQFINADEIEKTLSEKHYINLEDYKINTTAKTFYNFIGQSGFLQKTDLNSDNLITFNSNIIVIDKSQNKLNSYIAAAMAEFIRSQLMDLGESFSFETVMSHRSKVEILQSAQKSGYKTYLYFVSTIDPEINVGRVKSRVSLGGHFVSEEKIISRYINSLELLIDAIKASNRAYLFDNSFGRHKLIAEITNGNEVELMHDTQPNWYIKYVENKLFKAPF
jgi:predicted ABC-type ATPase